MSKYNGSLCRQCRREGVKLLLKGDRCFKTVCAFERKAKIPGQHTQSRRKMSPYGTQLREKQKLKRMYGLLERQFSNYFDKAAKHKGVTGDELLIVLERRIDNVLYRLGIAASRRQARQLISHRHFLLNGRRVNIPSILVKPNDVITVYEGSKKINLIQEALQSAAQKNVPAWLELDPSTLTGRVNALPTREQIDTQIQEQLIVEFYSR